MNQIKNFRAAPMNAYSFNLTNPKNYKNFINKALEYADTVCMTYNGSYDAFKKSEYAFLKESVIGHEMTNQTPVTTGNPWVCLIYLKTDYNTTKWLKEKNSIYDFVYYDEWFCDLCFAKNGEIVFSSCTHEEFCYINNELAERIKFAVAADV